MAEIQDLSHMLQIHSLFRKFQQVQKSIPTPIKAEQDIYGTLIHIHKCILKHNSSLHASIMDT